MTRHSLSVFALGASLLLATFMLVPASASACSCLFSPDWGFLLEDDGPIPKNANGVIWVGGSEVSEADFKVERLSGKSAVAVPFELVEMAEQVKLVKPTAPMKPGERYRFSTTKFHYNGARGGDPKTQSFDLSVSELALELRDKDVTLSIKTEMTDKLQVAAGASCSNRVKASVAELVVKLPEKYEVFRQHLFFNTLVDGKPYRAKASLCQMVPHGRSWIAPGVDRVFAVCGGRAVPGAEPGKHEVTMQVIFKAGADKAVTPKAVPIELNCK